MFQLMHLVLDRYSWLSPRSAAGHGAGITLCETVPPRRQSLTAWFIHILHHGEYSEV